MAGQTRKCYICGEPYKVYNYQAGDQSVCSECRARADKKVPGQHGKVINCPICGKPYEFCPYCAADQSACPECVNKAENKSQWKCRP